MKVSVCIPTYNQEDYIEATVRSAATQVPRPLEIIVSDDCSTDATPKILDRLADEYDFLRVVYQPKNLGIGGNVNSCLRLAKGQYLVKLDSDDLLLPGYLSELSDALDSHPDAGFAHAQVQEIDENGNVTRLRTLYRDPGPEEAEVALRRSLSGFRVAANILMFRRAALEAVDFVNPGMKFAEDFYLNVSMADAGYDNVYVDKVLSQYRVWSDEGQKRRRRKIVEVEGLTQVFEERIEPAFRKRGWDTREVDKRRAAFAAEQAVALGWDVFNPEEKEQLADALLRLSDAGDTRKLINQYQNGMGWINDWKRGTVNTLRQTAKKILKR